MPLKIKISSELAKMRGICTYFDVNGGPVGDMLKQSVHINNIDICRKQFEILRNTGIKQKIPYYKGNTVARNIHCRERCGRYDERRYFS